MAIETKVIMSSVLVHMKTSKSLEEALNKVEAMCEKDWILAANEAAKKVSTGKQSKEPNE